MGRHAPLEFEHGKAFGDVVFEPSGKFGGGAAVLGHEALKLLLRASQALGVPDGAQFLADGLADGLIGGVVDGVLGEVELAALPAGAGQHGFAGGLEARMIVRGEELHALQAARHQAFQEGAPVHLGLGEGDRDAQHAAPARGVDADGGEHGAIVRDAMFAGFLIARVEEEIAEAAEGRFLQAFSSPSSMAAARLTCVEDRPSIPNSASTFSTARVETPFTYISAAPSITARQERRPRSRLCGKNGLGVPAVLGTSRVSVPAGVSIFLGFVPLA